jgi:hypothetical protein
MIPTFSSAINFCPGLRPIPFLTPRGMTTLQSDETATIDLSRLAFKIPSPRPPLAQSLKGFDRFLSAKGTANGKSRRLRSLA